MHVCGIRCQPSMMGILWWLFIFGEHKAHWIRELLLLLPVTIPWPRHAVCLAHFAAAWVTFWFPFPHPQTALKWAPLNILARVQPRPGPAWHFPSCLLTEEALSSQDSSPGCPVLPCSVLATFHQDWVSAQTVLSKHFSMFNPTLGHPWVTHLHT